MAREKPKSPQEKRLETLAEKSEKQKRELVAQLRRTSNVQASCERTGVGRATYYKWRLDDTVFARAADDAIEAGRFLINDLAEGRLIRLIQNDDLGAIRYWLGHNHPKYSAKVIHEYSLVEWPQESVEEKQGMGQMFKQAVALMGLHGEDLKRHRDIQGREEEKEEEIDEKLKAYEEPEGI